MCGQRHVLDRESGSGGLVAECVSGLSREDAHDAVAVVVDPHAAERLAELVLPPGAELGQALADAGLIQELLGREAEIALQGLDERRQLGSQRLGEGGEGGRCGGADGRGGLACSGGRGGLGAGGRRADDESRGRAEGGELGGDTHGGLP